MNSTNRLWWRCLVLACVLVLLSACSHDKDAMPFESNGSDLSKLGVLVLSSGMDETYKPDWIAGYFDHLFPFFGAGFHSGGPIEGDDCYTLIHYASEAEAAICQVNEGVPIDVFCNVYDAEDQYPVTSITTKLLSFSSECSELMTPFIFLGHSTVDPETNTEILGPLVSDPGGAGNGIADFVEMAAFSRMETHYEHFKNQTSPHREQVVRWVYGNEMPDYYRYSQESTERSNILDALRAALPDTQIAVRVGWEAYMENKDVYGKEKFIADSTQTALRELIEDEKADRLMIISDIAHYSNAIEYGRCWVDAQGKGISIVPGKTYRSCVEDLTDDYGPTTQSDLDSLLSVKPWEKYRTPFPEIVHLAHEIAPSMQIEFTTAFGHSPYFSEGIVGMLKHAIDKFEIPVTASVRVISATHGFGGGYMNGAECDIYFETVDTLARQVNAAVTQYLSTSWQGHFDVVHGENEFAQPGEGSSIDEASVNKPFGSIMGTGELIDQGINGRYVNELGLVVDNGSDNFDYIIVIPVPWNSDNVDTIVHFRADTLANHEYAQVASQMMWVRQHENKDGEEYAPDFYDEEYFSVSLMDAQGWESMPADQSGLVAKGSTTNPTTVILTGTFLSFEAEEPRELMTQAVVDVVKESLNNPQVGGSLDQTCVSN